MIVDHLLKFTNETQAHIALDPLGYGVVDPDTGNPLWDGSRVLPGQRVIVTEAVVDAEGNVVSPAELADGHWVTVSTTGLDDRLTSLPFGACRIAYDRASGIVFVAADLDLDVMRNARVEPTWSGVTYPFREAA